MGMLIMAQDFWESANKLNTGPQWTAASTSTYYLFFHAMELALKSFIYFKNQDEKELKKIGHDLQEVWIKAEELGIKQIFTETNELKVCIDMVSEMYKGKEFEYYYSGFKRVPVIGVVSSVCNALNAELDLYYRRVLKSTNVERVP